MMYLEYTLQKYFDCVPVTIVIPMATAYSQNTFFPVVLFDYLIVYDAGR